MTTTSAMEQQDTARRYDALYERHGRPLEAEHRGEFLAVSSQGDTILGGSLRDVAEQASARFGPGSFVYKIGERAVGKWR